MRLLPIFLLRLRPKRPTGAAIIVLASLLVLGGCSARKAPPSASSAGDLIVLGRENMQAQNFERARAAFNRILQEYPESNLRSVALISLADSFYASKEYDEAKFQYDKFVQLYPVNPQTPRAYYFLAMCDYNRLASVDRDQIEAENALANFRRLVRQFPDTPLSAEAGPKVTELEARLARKELLVARFHYSGSNYQSAIPRFLGLLKDYPKAPAAAAALYYLADSYRREENFRKAGMALRRLIRSHPKSRYHKKARSLLRKLPKLAQSASKTR